MGIKEIVTYPYIEKKKGICGNSPIIKGTRIRVIDIIIEYTLLGYSPDDIVNAHPFLTLAHVHDAISYYYDHQEEIDEEIIEREKKASKIEKEIISRG